MLGIIIKKSGNKRYLKVLLLITIALLLIGMFI